MFAGASMISKFFCCNYSICTMLFLEIVGAFKARESLFFSNYFKPSKTPNNIFHSCLISMNITSSNHIRIQFDHALVVLVLTLFLNSESGSYNHGQQSYFEFHESLW